MKSDCRRRRFRGLRGMHQTAARMGAPASLATGVGFTARKAIEPIPGMPRDWPAMTSKIAKEIVADRAACARYQEEPGQQGQQQFVAVRFHRQTLSAGTTDIFGKIRKVSPPCRAGGELPFTPAYA